MTAEETGPQRNSASSGGTQYITHAGNIYAPHRPRRRRAAALGVTGAVVVVSSLAGVWWALGGPGGDKRNTATVVASHSPSPTASGSPSVSASPSRTRSKPDSPPLTARTPSSPTSGPEQETATAADPAWVCRTSGYKYPTAYGYGLLPCFRAVNGAIQYTVKVQAKQDQTITVYYWLAHYNKGESPYEPAGARMSCQLSLTPGREQACPVVTLAPPTGDYIAAATVNADSYDGVNSDIRHWSGHDLTAAAS